MNRWKMVFGCSLAVLIFTILFSAYILIDQAYNITYYKEESELIETDFEDIIDIVNHTNLSKHEIATLLKRRILVEANFPDSNDTILSYNNMMDADTILLYTVKLVFEDDKLKEIKNDTKKRGLKMK